MRIAITDANIFIDIIDLGFIDFLFQIELEIHTTMGVIDELSETQQVIIQKYIADGQLNLHFQTEEQFLEIEKMDLDRGFSDADSFLLFLCQSNNMLLLSGERKMRIFCTENQLEIRGIIWIFDEFLRLNLINEQTAILKMEELLVLNQWLPMKICRQRMNQWRKGI